MNGIVALAEHRCTGCGHTSKVPAGALSGVLPFVGSRTPLKRCGSCEELVVATAEARCPLCSGTDLTDAERIGRLGRLACPRCSAPMKRAPLA